MRSKLRGTERSFQVPQTNVLSLIHSCKLYVLITFEIAGNNKHFDTKISIKNIVSHYIWS